MKARPLELSTHDGWSACAPPRNGPHLLVEKEGSLMRIEANGRVVRSFGRIGNVPCPLAVDDRRGIAYRYCCEARAGGRDYSELRSFDLIGGRVTKVLSLRLNQWVLWMLAALPKSSSAAGPTLFGLIASDEPSEVGVHIRHQLFFFDAARPPLRLRPLCRDAYHPIALSLKARRMIFSGAEGLHLVGIGGERLAEYRGQEGPRGRGASFIGTKAERAVVGGGGLFLWDFTEGRMEQLTDQGHWPVWDSRRNGVWYSSSSGDLRFYDLATRQAQKILEVTNQRFLDTAHAQPAVLSADGRYLAQTISERRLRGATKHAFGDAGQRDLVFAHDHCLLIADIAQKRFWQLPGQFENVRLLTPNIETKILTD